MRRKIVSYLFALLIFGVGAFIVFHNVFQTPQKKFLMSWEGDLALLQKSGILPKEFFEIKKIETATTSDFLKGILEKDGLPKSLKTNSMGSHVLQIFLDQNEEGFVVIQYDVVTPEGNTMWELSRTLSLMD